MLVWRSVNQKVPIVIVDNIFLVKSSCLSCLQCYRGDIERRRFRTVYPRVPVIVAQLDLRVSAQTSQVKWERCLFSWSDCSEDRHVPNPCASRLDRCICEHIDWSSWIDLIRSTLQATWLTLWKVGFSNPEKRDSSVDLHFTYHLDGKENMCVYIAVNVLRLMWSFFPSYFSLILANVKTPRSKTELRR